MDYLTRQLLLLLTKLTEVFQKQSSAIHDIEKSNSKQQDNQNKFLNNLLSEYKKVEAAKSTSSKQGYSVQRTIAWATSIAAGAAILYGFVTYKQWQTQIHQFEVVNRPWITWTGTVVDKVNLTKLIQDEPDGEKQSTEKFPFAYTLVNKGKVPAKAASFAISHSGLGTFNKWVDLAPCGESDKQLDSSPPIYDLLFPDVPVTKRTQVAPVLNPAGLRFIIACISYWNSIDRRLQHTKLLYLGISEKKPLRFPWDPERDYYPITQLELIATLPDSDTR